MDVTIYGTTIDLLHVLVGTLIPMIVGMLWYSPVLFAKPWMEAVGKPMDQLQGSKAIYIIPLVGGFIMTFTLAWFFGATKATTVLGCLRVAIACWGGFTFTSILTNTVFVGRPLKLAGIDAGYYLVNVIGIALLFGFWK